MKTFKKDPSDILDYSIRWANFLDTDTISTSSWTLESGITNDNDSNDTDSTTVWISGGSEGYTYTVTNRIVTAGGRTKEQSFKLKVENL